MKGIRKADEMEMSISLRAMRLAWVYSGIFLLAWIWMDWARQGTFNSMAMVLLASQLVVYWSAQLVLKRRLGRDEE